nr:immunoglobulin light chain junction region [Macaca mulatta]MOX46519.1 immunoglobulin light chain junction region [Macaca mulatta]
DYYCYSTDTSDNHAFF